MTIPVSLLVAENIMVCQSPMVVNHGELYECTEDEVTLLAPITTHHLAMKC